MQNDFPKTIFFSSILLLCLSLALFFYFFKVTNKNYEEFTLKESEWRIETKHRDEIKSMERSVKIIKKEITELDAHFAKSSDVVPFLGTLEDFAKKAGVTAEITSVDMPKEGNILMVGLMASGSFNSSYKFLTLLENSPYELEIISMEMNKEGSGTGTINKSSKWLTTLKIKLLSFVK